MPKQTPADLVAEYREAFRAANGRECEPLSYERGWFVFRYPETGRVESRCRRVELERWRDTLRERVARRDAA